MSSLVTLSCGRCGIEFAVPEHWYNARAKNGENRGEFCCPNGHSRVFREPELDQVRRERDRLKQELAQKDDELAKQHKKLVASQAEVTKLKTRASAGVCPCCKRSFENLRRHMTTKHPDFHEKANAQ